MIRKHVSATVLQYKSSTIVQGSKKHVHSCGIRHVYIISQKELCKILQFLMTVSFFKMWSLQSFYIKWIFCSLKRIGHMILDKFLVAKVYSRSSIVVQSS